MTTLQRHIHDRVLVPARESLFIYPGAKSGLIAKQAILNTLPRGFREYREPFVGGGSIAMTMPLGVKRWINDLDAGLVAVYKAMRERPEQFIGAVRSLVSKKTPENEATFKRLLLDDQADLAVRYLFLNRFAYNGRVRLHAPWRYRTTFSEERGYAFFETDRLEQAVAVIQGMTITQGDYAPLLREPGNEVVVFIDAPYVVETRAHVSAQWYDKSFPNIEDHYRLRDEVNASIHRVLLTYDDEPLIRKLYRGFNMREIAWTYRGNLRRRRGRELIITNYDL